MARKRESRRSKLRGITTTLVSVVVLFCILSSWNAKNGSNFLSLPPLPFFDFVQEWLDALGDRGNIEPDNALAAVNPLADANLEVHFLDVGQAESILVKGPKANLLIDAGENHQGDDVIRYLKSNGVDRLDFIIGTHPHSDHIGGLDTVINKMKVDRIYLPHIPDELAPTTATYMDLLLAIENKHLKVTAAKPGRSIDLGEGARLDIIGPRAEYSDLNNMSVVARLIYGETSFLFTGDLSAAGENDILDSDAVLHSDVLNVGHHGSDTSSTTDFLNAVAPRIAVISCGMDNSYGHPHRNVIERLDARDIRILRTDRNGAVVIVSDGERLGVTTQK